MGSLMLNKNKSSQFHLWSPIRQITNLPQGAEQSVQYTTPSSLVVSGNKGRHAGKATDGSLDQVRQTVLCIVHQYSETTLRQDCF